MLAVLASGSRDIAAAEDALHDALERAMVTWPRDGIPANPAGWIVVTARHRMLDRLRSPSSKALSIDDESRREPAAPVDDRVEPDEIPDRRLALLFVCAHPAIDPSARTPLMLQTVLGLDAERIAAAFALPTPTMAQRLVRAKRRIKETGVPFVVPDARVMPERLPPVLEAIYGAYAIDWPVVAGRIEVESLSAEALALAEVAAGLMPNEPEVLGLAALICLSLARASARLDADGRFVPIDEQDPQLWNRELIASGERHLLTASRLAISGAGDLRRVGRFQLEAAIQSAYDDRARTGDVDRRMLVTLHRALVAAQPTLGARVALAAAIGEADGEATGLAELDAIEDPALTRFQPTWATRAHLLAGAGRREEADAAYRRAIDLTVDPVMRAHLVRRRAQVGGG
ncbi:RNA polymerase subunit sigma-70 [Planctomonas sp. JC2975]|nr:RNA polymerase subunit sigma-70 [Planctomonas sp. JC2975]